MGHCFSTEDQADDITVVGSDAAFQSSRTLSDFGNDTPPTVTSSAEISNQTHKYSLTAYCQSFSGTCAPKVYKVNQDDYFCELSIGGNENLSLFGVFDGHGAFGTESSGFVKKRLLEQFRSDTSLEKNSTNCLRAAFNRVHQEIKDSSIDTSCSGTTAVVCLLNGTNVYVSNAGDSRCVLGYYPSPGKLAHKDLSVDHKPDLPGEKKRIESNGGRVEAVLGYDDEPIGPARVWVGDEMYPGLAMSRSIGDTVAHSVGCSCDPDVITHTLDFTKDKFIILASDGVWEFITSPEAVSIVASQSDPQQAADTLCREALKRWRSEEEICDDITVVVVFFS
eukprot:c17310_g1_i1.p1 GENE.c17310_g1_i1~~c17310_g1_i1.p1  ORF type:complete len:350 (+),score=130.58 c17310_g1_i1:45-1052(+)